MKTLNYTVKIHPAAEGGYWAEVPALPGCFTQGESLQQVVADAQAILASHLQGLMRLGIPIPQEKEQKKALAMPVFVQLPI
jgi:predicted RNase H-like HicB family nuclease